MDHTRLLTRSLRESARGETIAGVLAAALAAVEPAAAVARHLRRDGDLLMAGERAIDLRAVGRILVVGAGKAGAPMARAAAELLGDRLAGGLVVVKDGHLEAEAVGPVRVVEAGHPVPDERGVAAAHELAALLGGLAPDDLVLAVISGGGSALLTLPADGVALGDVQALTGALLASGASIGEINTLRKHLDRVKGGGLARLAHPAALVTLILSDVVGNPLDSIASGPTVGDPGTFAEALGVLERYGLVESAPPAIVAHLRRGLAGELPETPKPGDPLFARVHNLLVGDNRQAAAAALAAAEAAGFTPVLLTTGLEGEAREAGRFLAAILREAAGGQGTLRRPICVVAGGETTVTLRGDGRGGRNQELALAAAPALAGLRDVALVALATDGGDGPTDAAGAVVTGETMGRARALGLDQAGHLARNDAYPFFAALDDLLRPGPSGTNVNDLTFLFAW
ncbi:MAG TPA: glycerate kinase [Chloroflexaceae bacterium]|nr:glycerate kinase [Chloroflexaceae bacterium]